MTLREHCLDISRRFQGFYDDLVAQEEKYKAEGNHLFAMVYRRLITQYGQALLLEARGWEEEAENAAVLPPLRQQRFSKKWWQQLRRRDLENL